MRRPWLPQTLGCRRLRLRDLRPSRPREEASSPSGEARGADVGAWWGECAAPRGGGLSCRPRTRRKARAGVRPPPCGCPRGRAPAERRVCSLLHYLSFPGLWENLLLLSEARITPCLIFPSLAASPPIGGRAPTPPPSNACIPDTPHPRRPPRSVRAHGCLLAPPSSPDAPLPAAAASPHTRRLSPEDPGPDAAEQAGAGPGLREDSGRAW